MTPEQQEVGQALVEMITQYVYLSGCILLH